MLTPATLDQLSRLLHDARRVLVITGAGMSRDSGIPTYRGVGGLYDDAPLEHGLRIEQILSAETLAERPELTWGAIARIEAASRGARPHIGHHVLAALDEPGRRRVVIVTQNVDGLHGDAGSRHVVELHGTIRRLTCTGCGWVRAIRDFSGLTIPPACARCGGPERPAVVLFGEALPSEALATFQAELSAGFDLVVTIGTTSLFGYIVEPVLRAAELGLPTVEINPGETATSGLVSLHVRAGAAAALAGVAARLRLVLPPSE